MSQKSLPHTSYSTKRTKCFFGRRKLPQCLGQRFSAPGSSVSCSSVSSSTPTLPATSPETLEASAGSELAQSLVVSKHLSPTWLQRPGRPTSLLSGPNLNVTSSRLPAHPLCPEVPRVFSSLFPSSSSPDDIYVVGRQATSMPRDDLIFKFPPVKTRREKWKTLGENHVIQQLRQSTILVILVWTFTYNFSEIAQ